ncbi:MAG: hypothetical protein QF464_15465, partial [Myxococcota bacterium]|nr:hypothetical protein [Myxococcota bacterium]
DATGDTLQLRIATRPESRGDAAYLAVARAFAAQLSGKALEGRPVDVALCDDDLNVVTEAEGFRWGVHTSLEACGLYVGPDIALEQGTRLLQILAEDLGCATERSFRLSREAGGLNLYFVLEADELATDARFHQARLTAGRASDALFGAEPMTVHAADVYYVSKRSAPSVYLGPSVTRRACRTFRSDGVDLATMGRFVTYVEGAGFCEKDPKVYRLSRDEKGWHVGSVVDTAMSPNLKRALKVAFGLVAAMFRGAVFGGQPTHIDLCDAVFEHCESIIGPDLGLAFLHGRCSVFHDRAVDDATLARFRRWLDIERFCADAEQLVRVRRDRDGWAFHLAVRSRLLGSPELATLATRLEDQLSRQVFEGQPVRFVATDEQLNPTKAAAKPLSVDP